METADCEELYQQLHSHGSLHLDMGTCRSPRTLAVPAAGVVQHWRLGRHPCGRFSQAGPESPLQVAVMGLAMKVHYAGQLWAGHPSLGLCAAAGPACSARGRAGGAALAGAERGVQQARMGCREGERLAEMSEAARLESDREPLARVRTLHTRYL